MKLHEGHERSVRYSTHRRTAWHDASWMHRFVASTQPIKEKAGNRRNHGTSDQQRNWISKINPKRVGPCPEVCRPASSSSSVARWHVAPGIIVCPVTRCTVSAPASVRRRARWVRLKRLYGLSALALSGIGVSRSIPLPAGGYAEYRDYLVVREAGGCTARQLPPTDAPQGCWAPCGRLLPVRCFSYSVQRVKRRASMPVSSLVDSFETVPITARDRLQSADRCMSGGLKQIHPL